MKKKSGILALILSAAMVLGFGTVAQASSYDDPIDSIELDIEYTLSSGMTTSDIDVTSETDGVDTVTVSSVTNTSYGKRPTVTIKVKADTSDGYYFDSDDAATLKTESAFTFTGDEVDYKSSKRTSNSYVTVTVRLPKIGSDDDSTLDVDEVSWEGDSGVVEWSEAEDATKYSVKLLRGSSTKTTVTTTSTSYDFSSAIQQYGTGTYTVRVKAYADSYGGDDWTESEEFEGTEDNLSSVTGSSSTAGSTSSSTSSPSSSGTTSGAWMRDSTGWWYCNADRSYTTNNWQQINGGWYYFNAQGYMVTGWMQSPYSGLWYYLSTDDATLGRMVTNTMVDGTYYVNAEGVWTS